MYVAITSPWTPSIESRMFLFSFPFDIPNGTRIPDWAYQDVTVSSVYGFLYVSSTLE